MKKVFSILLIVMIVFTTFAGCVSKTSSSEKGIQATDSNEKTTSKDSNEGSNLTPAGYPIVKERITLRMMGASYALHGPWDEMAVMKKMEEVTNIHMDITTVPQDTYAEKKNLAFASGDLPDLFFRGILNTQDEEVYGGQGLLIPLLDLINNHSVNLKKVFNERDDVRKTLTCNDGNIYSLPYLYKTKTMANCTWINIKWLDNVGLKMPQTTEDLYNVLKAFKEKDPNTNGKDDEIPLSLQNLSLVHRLLLPAFGILSLDQRWMTKDGKVVFAPMEDAYREYLLYAKKLYSEKLIDQEMVSHTLEQWLTKLSEYTVGIIGDYLSRIPEENQEEYRVISPLTSHLNNEKMTPPISGIVPGTFAITSKNQHPEATIRWVDIFFTFPQEPIEGISSMVLCNGFEGEHWEFTNAEKTRYRMIPPDNGLSIGDNKHKYVTPGGAGSVPMNLVLNMIPEGNLRDELKAQGSDENYFPYMKDDVVYPPVRFTKEELQQKGIIENDIYSYVGQMTTKFIVGDEPIENWDAYIKTIQSMGIDELKEIYQKGLDRWNSIK